MLSDRIQKFLYGQDIHSFADRYTLDGMPLSTRHSVGMVATAAVGSLAAAPGPIAEAFLEELWNTAVPSGEQRYYDGMLYLMSLISRLTSAALAQNWLSSDGPQRAHSS